MIVLHVLTFLHPLLLDCTKCKFLYTKRLCQIALPLQVWPKIKSALVEQDLLGPALQLRCRVHQDRVTRVKNVSDFDQVSEGGCNQLCMADLDCGHTCVRLCHIYDRDHQNYKCKQPCTK